jgi:hypothetical protein
MPMWLQWFAGYALLLALVACGDAESWAAGGKYTGEGTGVILQADQVTARERAMQEALRDTIEQAVVDLFGADKIVARRQSLKSRLYTRPWQYVRSYRVLWEYPDIPQKVYRVGVEAEVSVNDVRRALEATSSSRTRQVVPRGVSVAPAQGGIN